MSTMAPSVRQHESPQCSGDTHIAPHTPCLCQEGLSSQLAPLPRLCDKHKENQGLLSMCAHCSRGCLCKASALSIFLSTPYSVLLTAPDMCWMKESWDISGAHPSKRFQSHTWDLSAHTQLIFH